MIFDRIRTIPIGTKIRPDYTVKGLGKSRGEEALVYLVPNRSGGKPSEKRVRSSEWETAYQHLLSGNQMTRNWFEENMPDAAKDGTCGFRVTGEVFVLLGLAREASDGSGLKYVLASLAFPMKLGVDTRPQNHPHSPHNSGPLVMPLLLDMEL
jgi:hypothetical protein